MGKRVTQFVRSGRWWDSWRWCARSEAKAGEDWEPNPIGGAGRREGVAAKWACKCGVAHAVVAGLGRQVRLVERKENKFL
jgi:hypothetical protein